MHHRPAHVERLQKPSWTGWNIEAVLVLLYDVSSTIVRNPMRRRGKADCELWSKRMVMSSGSLQWPKREPGTVGSSKSDTEVMKGEEGVRLVLLNQGP